MNDVTILEIDQLEYQVNPDIALVVKYINRVWNQKMFAEISVYLDDHYVDHSMPHVSVQNKEGLLLYLREMAQMVSHVTEIIGLTTLGELVICHIRISLTTLFTQADFCGGAEVFFGYRTFRMFNNKIAEHWEIF